MAIKTTSNRMISLIDLYDMQTTYFANAIDEIPDSATHNRLNTKANHVAWLTGSMVEQRFEIANHLGIKEQQAAHELFKDGKGIQDDATYPSLTSYKKDWDKISPVLKEALVKISDEKLDTKFEMMPGMSMTIYELISFCSYREANCIGQIALWRRLLGYAPMKYQ